MIGKIEQLFKDDPLAFDELNIKENLKRWDKKRKLRFMNKTAEEIKKETIEKENQMKDHLENIVKKYNIKVEDESQMSNNKRHCVKAL